jgi:hypothetical protein
MDARPQSSNIPWYSKNSPEFPLSKINFSHYVYIYIRLFSIISSKQIGKKWGFSLFPQENSMIFPFPQGFSTVVGLGPQVGRWVVPGRRTPRPTVDRGMGARPTPCRSNIPWVFMGIFFGDVIFSWSDGRFMGIEWILMGYGFIPSGKLRVCELENGHWWWFMMDLPCKHGDFP